MKLTEEAILALPNSTTLWFIPYREGGLIKKVLDKTEAYDESSSLQWIIGEESLIAESGGFMGNFLSRDFSAHDWYLDFWDAYAAMQKLRLGDDKDK